MLSPTKSNSNWFIKEEDIGIRIPRIRVNLGIIQILRIILDGTRT
jgi:hypothetical protein